ncbi:hypothetical protein Mgra_00007063, partial [Meloidogyne graminicola]
NFILRNTRRLVIADNICGLSFDKTFSKHLRVSEFRYVNNKLLY